MSTSTPADTRSVQPCTPPDIGALRRPGAWFVAASVLWWIAAAATPVPAGRRRCRRGRGHAGDDRRRRHTRPVGRVPVRAAASRTDPDPRPAAHDGDGRYRRPCRVGGPMSPWPPVDPDRRRVVAASSGTPRSAGPLHAKPATSHQRRDRAVVVEPDQGAGQARACRPASKPRPVPGGVPRWRRRPPRKVNQ